MKGKNKMLNLIKNIMTLNDVLSGYKTYLLLFLGGLVVAGQMAAALLPLLQGDSIVSTWELIQTAWPYLKQIGALLAGGTVKAAIDRNGK